MKTLRILSLFVAVSLLLIACADTRDDDGVCNKCAGATLPSVAMLDVQPQSPRYGESYALDTFEGKTTVVALFAAW